MVFHTPHNISRDTKDQTIQQHGMARFRANAHRDTMAPTVHAPHAAIQFQHTVYTVATPPRTVAHGHAVRDTQNTKTHVMDFVREIENCVLERTPSRLIRRFQTRLMFHHPYYT